MPRKEVLDAQAVSSAAGLTIALRAGGVAVSGTVEDATGGAVAGAWVTARSAGSEPSSVAEARSDRDGKFHISVVAGWLEVSAHAEAYSVATDTVYAPMAGVRLVLEPAAAMGGRVVSRAGHAPLAELRVSAWKSSSRAHDPSARITVVSAPDGSFRFDGLSAGSYDLEAVNAWYRSPTQRQTLGVGQVNDTLLLEAEPATTLSGRLEGGAECADGWVHLSGPVRVAQPLLRDGVEFTGLLPGRYQVVVDCSALGTEITESIDVAERPVSRSWRLEAGAALRGRVEGPGGLPLAAMLVDVRPVGEPQARASRSCTTDAAGEFACFGLSRGDYLCRALRGNAPASPELRISWNERAPQPVTLRAFGAANIHVFVAAAPGGLARAARMTPIVQQPGGLPIFGRPEADYFIFTGLALGEYDVYVEKDSGDSGGSSRVRLTRDGEVQEVRLRASVGEPLAGRVIDEHGQPVPDAQVAVSASVPGWLLMARSVAPAWTDVDGSFELPGLSAGRYRLVATHESEQAVLEGVSPGASPVSLRLQPSASLSGSVITDTGEPVLDVDVSAFDTARGEARSAVLSNGTWSLLAIPPGTYQLQANSARGSGWRQVVLAPRESRTLVLTVHADANSRESRPTETNQRERND